MRIAVFGVGGVGGYLGGRLAKAGEDVVFIARGAHLEALRTHGLRVDSVKGDFVVQPVQATDDPTQVGIVDAVLVGVKAWQVSAAAEAMRPMIGSETFVMPVQNGVEAPAQLVKVLGAQPVLGGLCAIVSFISEPGHIRHAAVEPVVWFGEMDNRTNQRVERLRQAFTRAGVTAEIPPDIQVALWGKLAVMAPWSGVGAVTRAPAGVWRSVLETRRMVELVVQEVLAVARARNISLPEDAMSRAMDTLDGLAPDATASMQRDIMDGRPSELEYQNGAVVRLGREAGVDTPVNSFTE